MPTALAYFLTSFQGGAYIFQLMDFYAVSGMSLLWVCFFQTIAISWIFGVNRFADCVKEMMGVQLGAFWRICWVAVAPFVMMVSIIRIVDYTKLINVYHSSISIFPSFITN